VESEARLGFQTSVIRDNKVAKEWEATNGLPDSTTETTKKILPVESERNVLISSGTKQL